MTQHPVRLSSVEPTTVPRTERVGVQQARKKAACVSSASTAAAISAFVMTAAHQSDAVVEKAGTCQEMTHRLPHRQAQRPEPRAGHQDGGLPLTPCSDHCLIQGLRWIESDTPLRTEDELFKDIKNQLGFPRRAEPETKPRFDSIPHARNRQP